MFLSSLTQKRYTFIALAITLSQKDPATTRVHKSKSGFSKSVARHLAFIFRPSPSIHPILPPPLVQISRRCWQRSPLPLLSPREHAAPSTSTVVLGRVQSTMLSSLSLSLSMSVCLCAKQFFQNPTKIPKPTMCPSVFQHLYFSILNEAQQFTKTAGRCRF